VYIYNVTINVLETVESRWLDWMRKKHIPAMLATGKFTSAKMAQVMVKEEMGGATYSIQYSTDSRETLDAYYKQDAEALRDEALQLFANQFVAFRTELQIVEEFKIYIFYFFQ